MIHPTVHAALVEDVPAVPQPPDLVLHAKLRQTHRAARCRRHVIGAAVDFSEFHDGEEFADEEGGEGGGPVGDSGGVGIGPGSVGVEEFGESEAAEEEEDEVSEEAEEGECAEEDVREEHLRVTHRKTHCKINKKNK